MENKIKLLAVVGPTASGKSNLAVQLAQALNGEIISCDSMQIYENMDIGTAKITLEEMRGVRHHLLGILPENADFSVSDYVALAEEAIADISKSQKLPILTGGTGLYARSLLYGVDFTEDSRNQELRDVLTNQLRNGEASALYHELKLLDPKAAENIHLHNEKRVIRALEYCLTTHQLFSEQSVIHPENPKYEFLMLCLGFQDREKLYAKINARVDQMMHMGLLEEAGAYYNSPKSAPTSRQAIGYKELFPFFDGKISLDTAVENIKKETRHYAKRQLTWFKREHHVTWLYVDTYPNEAKLLEHALTLAAEFIGK